MGSRFFVVNSILHEIKIKIEIMLNITNIVVVCKIKTLAILQFCNQIKPQTYLEKCDFISNEEFYLAFTLFLRFCKCQYVNNNPLFFTIHQKMHHKLDGNQIVDLQLDVHLMKSQSTTVEMF